MDLDELRRRLRELASSSSAGSGRLLDHPHDQGDEDEDAPLDAALRAALTDPSARAQRQLLASEGKGAFVTELSKGTGCAGVQLTAHATLQCTHIVFLLACLPQISSALPCTHRVV